MEPGDYVRIAILVLVAPLLTTLLAAARMRLRRPSRQRVAFEDVPDVDRIAITEAALELVGFGFELVGPVSLSPPEVTDDDTRIAFQLHDPAHRTFAYVSVYGARRYRPVQVSLESFEAGPEGPVLLLTEGKHALPALAESARLAVIAAPAASDVSTLLEAHRAALGTRATLDPSPDEALALGDACHAAWIDEGLRTGRLVIEGEHVRFSLWGALRMALWARLRSGAFAALQSETQRGAAEAPPDPELEARQHVRLDSVERRAVPRPLAAVLFVLGAGLSALWFASSDPAIGLALLVVILFHELGHALAMRLFGYGDTRIYFIPGFGGAAVGQKRDASIHVEGVVLLAGPLPGIVLGLALAIVASQLPADPAWEPLREPTALLALAAVLVNYVNLLPALPLDGGRLAHRITSGLHPLLDVAFRIASVGLLGLTALAMGDMLFGILAVVFAIQTPATYRAAVLEQALREAGSDGWPERRRLVEAYRRITVRGAVARRALATQVAQRLAAPPAPIWARFLWSGLYVTAIVVPLVLGFATLLGLALAQQL